MEIGADDVMLYNKATGGLLYDADADADGKGAGVAVKIANLNVSLVLTDTNFVLIEE
jgi:hypothetical protein